ncbi:MAG: DNRLRE domain-containing protein, partial [Chloroflexi bacterium]|nr:DNRLRE domain-containing protein [Chloroflexota bacterium]
DTIQFKVGGLLCAQTAMWSDGLRQNLNLTASGSLPTLTPTPSLVPTNTPTITPTPTETPSVTSTPAIIDLRPAQDTFISEWEPNSNYGTDQRLKVRNSPYRSLLYFDTSALPTNATVRSARLYLYLDWYTHQADRTATVNVYKVQTDWNESQATWNHRLTGVPWSANGCDGSADRSLTPSATTDVLTPSTWYSWDVTSLVQDWVWSPAGNKGMILITAAGRELRFHSMNMSSNKPYLRIDYVVGQGPGPTATATSSPAVTPSVQPQEEFSEFRNASQDTYIYNGEPDAQYENQGLRVAGQGYKKSLLNFDV